MINVFRHVRIVFFSLVKIRKTRIPVWLYPREKNENRYYNDCNIIFIRNTHAGIRVCTVDKFY